ncbi:type III secretion system YscI/HrpB-like protein [Pseudomonas sp. BT76 TE3572]|uniref:Type III secretion protein n=2 Tax=Pseudomonas TaxID=286 RepID=A0A059KVR4_9PSED|nr:type III secretion system inner rod subunit SctI [Pseudomonas mandelii]KDD66143.1 hypothetical protein V466_25515 [Pseudomonas mandelii PD30]
MSISTVNAVKVPSLDMEQSLVTSSSQADVDLFSSAMRFDDAPASSLSDEVAGAVSERLESTDKLSQQTMRSMKAMSATGDPMDMAQMSRSMSQYSLQMALTTKVVSKSAQAIDKLTNLQ